MPIYEYRCADGHRSEKLRKFENRKDAAACARCGAPASLAVAAPARTAWAWGDTQWNGFHDRGLNVTLRDKAHRESIMKQRGLRQVEDGEIEREISRATSEKDNHEAQVAKFQRVLADTGSTAKAMIETFPTPDA
jgi:putative FmdB family regulatory protein